MLRISDEKLDCRLAPRSGRENDVNGGAPNGSADESAPPPPPPPPKLWGSEVKSNWWLEREDEEDEDDRLRAIGGERLGPAR